MKSIRRNKDIIFNNTDLICIHKFKKFPVFMGCTSQNKNKDLIADMNWFISKKSGLIQLNPLLPMDVIYQSNHGSGCVGNIWMQHHQAFAEFINKYNFHNILEIGGLHGILSNLYNKLNKNINWTIIEPNPIPIKGIKAKIIKGFFDEKFIFKEPIDAIVHSHVLEHIYDPNKFFQNISEHLKDNGYLLFSVPNLREMIKRKYSNALNFEHTIFLTENYIEYLLNKYKFKILKKKYFKKDHSIFYACVRDLKVKPIKLSTKLFSNNKKLFLDFINYHKKLVNNLNQKIKKIKKKQKIFLFGAHVFSQYLISFGLKIQRVKYILDNDKNKHGKRLYGTNLKVFSPSLLKKEIDPVLILKAGVYNDEIKNDIVKNYNSKTIFL